MIDQAEMKKFRREREREKKNSISPSPKPSRLPITQKKYFLYGQRPFFLPQCCLSVMSFFLPFVRDLTIPKRGEQIGLIAYFENRD